MLCKKCKTSVLEGETTCSYCRAKIANVKRNKRITLLALAALTIGSGVYIYFHPIQKQPLAEEPFVQHSPELLEPTESDTTEEPNQEVIANKDNENEPPLEINEPLKLVSEALEKANRYYERNRSQSIFLTNRGYLYNRTLESYVTMSDLIDAGLMDEMYRNQKVLIMYLKPSDVVAVTGVAFESEEKPSETYDIYCGYETKQGFALSSFAHSIGFVSRSDFNKILTRYEYENGLIFRPGRSEREYQAILDVIVSYEFNTRGYDVRYMAFDDKYALVAVSDRNNSDQIFFYMLEKEEDQWTMYKVLQTLRTLSITRKIDFAWQVNQAAADFNLELLPPWDVDLQHNAETVFDWNEHMNEEHQDALGITTMLEEGDSLVFASQADDFIYLESQSGKVILVYQITYQPFVTANVFLLNDFREAERLMLELDANAPLFLIRQ